TCLTNFPGHRHRPSSRVTAAPTDDPHGYWQESAPSPGNFDIPRAGRQPDFRRGAAGALSLERAELAELLGDQIVERHPALAAVGGHRLAHFLDGGIGAIIIGYAELLAA